MRNRLCDCSTPQSRQRHCCDLRRTEEALNGVFGLEPYSATRAAVVALTRTSAAEYSGRDGRINAVLPGTIDTALLHHVLASTQSMEEAVKSQASDRTPGNPHGVGRRLLHSSPVRTQIHRRSSACRRRCVWHALNLVLDSDAGQRGQRVFGHAGRVATLAPRGERHLLTASTEMPPAEPALTSDRPAPSIGRTEPIS
ncbi:SDR family oxidoreductase [Rhodococcus koreensis]